VSGYEDPASVLLKLVEEWDSYPHESRAEAIGKWAKSSHTRSALAIEMNQLGEQRSPFKTLRFGTEIDHAADPQVAALRLVFIQECVKVDPSLSRELIVLWRLYAGEFRETLNFQLPGALPGWGWAARAFLPRSEPFRRKLADCLGRRNLNVPWIWDTVLFSFERWYADNSVQIYTPNPVILIPPTTARIHDDQPISAPRLWRIPGESQSQFEKRFRKATQEGWKLQTAEDRDMREFNEEDVTRGVRWLVQSLKTQQIAIIAKRERISPKTVRRHRAAAAQIIGFPLPAPRVGRPSNRPHPR
jgi:hypothetical protein